MPSLPPDPGPGAVLERARDVADRVLRPQAERADREGVRREVVDEVARAGLLGLGAPGLGVPDAVQREVTELLAGADGATWFVTTQHASPLQAVAGSGNAVLRERELPGLASGEVLAGIAIAHLRRPGPPAVTALPTPGGGLRLDGRVGWATSWGLADVLLLAGLTPGDEIALALLPAREQPGLHAGAPLPLAVMGGTRTVQLTLEGLEVGPDAVVSVRPAPPWREADRLKTANATPAVFGLLAEVVRRLGQVADRRGERSVADAAERLAHRTGELRTSAYRLLDEVPLAERVEERLRVRAGALELAVRGAAALVAASGGSALALDAAPQRLAREALFAQVQAQTGPVRAATLAALLPGD